MSHLRNYENLVEPMFVKQEPNGDKMDLAVGSMPDRDVLPGSLKGRPYSSHKWFSCLDSETYYPR